jgi:hypothetical protein
MHHSAPDTGFHAGELLIAMERIGERHEPGHPKKRVSVFHTEPRN